MVDSHVSFSDH